MSPRDSASFFDSLQDFARSVSRSSTSMLGGQPEDQLKAPVQELLREFGAMVGTGVVSATEAPVSGAGRPDIAVGTNGLLGGYVELKAPGTGANARKFTGRNKEQFKKFSSIPNLIYTDGNEWALYRQGERKSYVALSGGVVEDGADAVAAGDDDGLATLLRDFLSWDPITPATPRALAEMLAPLCHLLRDDVMQALGDENSNLSSLAREWRDYIFPDADDAQFADAYAQTLTYALLLARFSGSDSLDTGSAAGALQERHELLAQTLRVLADPHAKEEISTGVDLLERSISAVDPVEIARRSPGGDPWLYFYEDFLAAYDRKLRGDRGVYYTPIQVVRAQVNLISALLTHSFDKPLAFADDGVVALDPAAGTGTYPLTAIQHGLDLAAARYGKGMEASSASKMARNIHAFELLVGPYAVAHLRVAERVMDAGGSLPEDGVRVYLTDTLESPHAAPPGQFPLVAKELAEEHERALKVKKDTEVLVCFGNPPYDRQQIDPSEAGVERKGGWVRNGDGAYERALLEDFLQPAREAGAGVHLKNLYNDYVYFWRWALWKVFETTSGPGIVSFITASSYLRGPGFVGMREAMRRTFDELWILDLEGDNLGARKTENVFNIQTPVAIAVGVRHAEAKPEEPARVRYAKITGSRGEKLAALDDVTNFEDLEWRDCMEGWQNPFLPEGEGDYFAWPPLTDVFPWQQSGCMAGRKWPLATDKATLKKRWSVLASSDSANRKLLFKDSPTGKKHDGPVSSETPPAPVSVTPIAELNSNDPRPPIVPCTYRSFDRQWLIADSRLLDRSSPLLWQVHGEQQAFLTTLLRHPLGLGPAATIAGEIPDRDHFRGSFGGAVFPLWRDAAATEPNVTGGLLELLSGSYGAAVSAEDLFTYAYAVLGSPAYTESFSEELAIPGPRLPITRDATLFRRGAELGRALIQLHTYGERFGPDGKKAPVPRGRAEYAKAIPETPDGYPEDYAYDPGEEVLRVGDGEIRGVDERVWNYEVSGLRVVRSWLGYRMKDPAGRSSSPLDDIRPERWTGEMTVELLELLWVLEATVEKEPELAAFLEEVTAGPVFEAKELPQPSEEEKKPPKRDTEPDQEDLGLG